MVSRHLPSMGTAEAGCLFWQECLQTSGLKELLREQDVLAVVTVLRISGGEGVPSPGSNRKGSVFLL